MSTNLKYVLQFQTTGLGNVRQASAAINQVVDSAGKDSADRVQGLGRALQNLGRLSGMGALGTMVAQLDQINVTAGKAGDRLGAMLRGTAYVGVAVTAYQAMKEKIAEVTREIDKQIEATNRLGRASNDTLTDGAKGLGKIESTEDRQAFIEDAEAKKKKLTRDLADTTDMRAKASIQTEINALNLLMDQAQKMELKSKAQIESFKQGQADSASRADLVADSGRDRARSRDQFGFEKQLAETQDTKQGAEQRIQLILARQNDLQGRKDRGTGEIRDATTNGKPEELSRLLQERADLEGEQNRLTLAMIDEHKKIDDLVAKAKQAELKLAQDAAAERKKIATEMNREVRSRVDGRDLPQADSLAKRGIFVDGGGKDESIRWAKASADALGKLVTLISKLTLPSPAGASAWGE